MTQLGKHPQPTAPWRPLIFRVHCTVQKRWMKVRVPFAWFWYGDKDYGDPEVEMGTFQETNSKPPAQLIERMRQQYEGKTEPKKTVVAESPQPRTETLEERLDRMEQEVQSARYMADQARSASDPRNFSSHGSHGGGA